MDQALPQRLLSKGWTASEVARVTRAAAIAEKTKSKWMLVLDEFLYWGVLLIGVLGNLIFSILIVPILLALDGFSLYSSLVLLGLAFGALMVVVLKEAEKAIYKQHIIAGLFLPALALINVYVMSTLANRFAINVGLAFATHSPVWVSVAYVMGFVTPYVYNILRQSKRRGVFSEATAL